MTEHGNADSSAHAAMIALRDEIKARLLATEDYQALVALESALAMMGKAAGHTEGGGAHRRRDPGKGRPPRQSDMAFQAIKSAGVPLMIGTLVDRLAKEGAPVGGNDPRINLASVLSKDDRFRSVRIGGKSFWWVDDEPLPARRPNFMDLVDAAESGTTSPEGEVA